MFSISCHQGIAKESHNEIPRIPMRTAKVQDTSNTKRRRGHGAKGSPSCTAGGHADGTEEDSLEALHN